MSDYQPMWVTTELTSLDGSAVLRPGDTLIIRINSDRGITPERAFDIREQALAALPDLTMVVVIVADGLAIYRPDPPNPNGGTS